MHSTVITLSMWLALILLVSGCNSGESPEAATNGATLPSANSLKDKTPSGDAVPPAILRDIEKVAARQSQALAGATTIVHRAFHYRQGTPSTLGDEKKFIAVDVEIEGHTRNLDLDDIDVIDGTTDESFGSAPGIRLLRHDGSLEQNNSKWDTDSDSLRVLLIYAVPKHTESIKLGYWGALLSSKPTHIGEGKLQHDRSKLIEGVEFWPYPASRHFGDVWQRDRWLVIGLSTGNGVAVVDLQSWPPNIFHWGCNLLQAIEPAPDGGWIVITRVGRSSEDIRFPVWHHRNARPGESSLDNEAIAPTEHLMGVSVVGQTTFVYSDRILYRFANGNLDRVEELDAAKGVDGDFGVKYTHGQVSLADESRMLLWDGNAYACVDGKLLREWPLGIDEPYEFTSVPWGRDGFYFIEDRSVYRVRRGAPREQVMLAVENVMGIRAGPNGSLLFNLGDNADGYVGGIWFPHEDRYVPLSIGEISEKLTTSDVDALHWSDTTRRFYVVGAGGVFTLPGDLILKRDHQKLAVE